ncbi:hypothetical protein [Streptomyces canus]
MSSSLAPTAWRIPTSLAVRGTTAYIASGAYFTNEDPNVLAGRIAPGR